MSNHPSARYGIAPGGRGGKRKRSVDGPFPQDGDASQYSPQQNSHGQSWGRDHYENSAAKRRAGRGRGQFSQRSPVTSPTTPSARSRSFQTNSSQMSPTSLPEQNRPKPPVPPLYPQPNGSHTTITPPQPSLDTTAPAPYDYKHITNDNLSTWDTTGRTTVIDNGAVALKTQDFLALASIFQELIRSAWDRLVDASDAGSIVKEILKQVEDNETHDSSPTHHHLDGQSLFLDCLSIVAENITIPNHMRNMIFATGIPPPLIRQELDSTLLASLGMIRETFTKIGIRQQTNLLYRQSNYNLLREETEGYSKFVTELFTTSNNEPPSSAVVEETFERVKGMIGAFDLDVGRVLDVTLDVFAAVLAKQYRFFVKYLRASSWWPLENSQSPDKQWFNALPRWALPGSPALQTSDDERAEDSITRNDRDAIFWQRAKEIGMGSFFELGGRQVDRAVLDAERSRLVSTESSQSDEDKKWIDITGTMPPPGNKTAAQILGFKLRFYSSSARYRHDTMHDNLIVLAALLIKIGFISLRDLYLHLWPGDDKMDGVKADKMKEKAEKELEAKPGNAAATNALALAGELVDDTPEGIKRREAARIKEIEEARKNLAKVNIVPEKAAEAPPEEEELPEPPETKVQLLKNLLCIGAIPEALYMMGRFPWLADGFPELPTYIHRILNHSLQKVYEQTQPSADVNWQEAQKIPDAEQSGVPKGLLRFLDPSPRKTLRCLGLDQNDRYDPQHGSVDYKFYWDDWADNVPVCQSIDDVFTLCSTLLNFSGVKIGQDPTLLLKLARIGSHSLASDSSETNNARWTDLSKRLLLPALSLTKCNPGVVNEVFDLVKNFPITVRYNMYAEWYTGQTSRQPDIKAAFEQAKAEAKDLLKRISKTNIKPMGRALAKIAYASPGAIFSVALTQMEAYDNIVDTIIECARYLTYLAYDVLSWSLLSSLGGRGRTRVQGDGIFASRWLQVLSLFAGKVLKRYSVMNPTPVLQYVTRQLQQSNASDLIILEQVLSSMGGIPSDATFNEVQVQSMAGGKILQNQTMLQLDDRRQESKTTSRRLTKSLSDARLTGQLLILIAQERQTGIFKIDEVDSQTKLLGNMFDEIHRVLNQYVEFLRTNLSTKDFESAVPGVASLILDFGIETSVSFWTSRANINAAMAEHDAKAAAAFARKKSSIKDTAMAGQEEMNGNVANGQPAANGAIAAMTFTKANDVGDVPMEDVQTNFAEPAIAEADFNMNQATEVGPADQVLPVAQASPLPWHPVLFDLMESLRPLLPDDTWKILSPAFYVTFWQLSLNDLLVPTGSYDDEISRQQKRIQAISSDRSDISLAGAQRKDREKKVLNDLQDRLRSELKDQVSSYTSTRSRLQKEKEHWFAGTWGKWDTLNVALIEHCFLPRILFSPLDALYAFKILKFLHSSGATNFRTLGVLDQMFNEKRLTAILFLCSSKEAENLGRFLNELLRDLSRWHKEKAVFDKEAYGTKKDLPGFSKKMKNEKTVESFWNYEEFRRVLLKWHRNLNAALKTCINSGEYMHIRNAISVLRAVCQYFPAVNWMGKVQVTVLAELGNGKSETREDLKIAARSLLGQLKRREKDWVLPQAFNLISNSDRPSSDAQTGRLEVEDGEIEDARMMDAPSRVETTNVQPKPNAEQPPQAKTPPKVDQSSKVEVQQASEASAKVDVLQRAQPPPKVEALLRPEVLPSAVLPAAKTDSPALPMNRQQAPDALPHAQHTLPDRPPDRSRTSFERPPRQELEPRPIVGSSRGINGRIREPPQGDLPEKPAAGPTADERKPPTPDPTLAGIHPDRLKAIESTHQPSRPQVATRPPSQSNDIRLPSAPPAPLPAPLPRGPRSSVEASSAPSGPSQATRGPPTGPSFNNENTRGDKRFAGIQNMLQQSNSSGTGDRSNQGTSIRGTSNRKSNTTMPSPSTSGPPPPSFPRQEAPQGRGDAFAGRGDVPPLQHREDNGQYNRNGGRSFAREGVREPPVAPTLPRQDLLPGRGDIFAGRTNGPPSSQQNGESIAYIRGGGRNNGRDGLRSGERRPGRFAEDSVRDGPQSRPMPQEDTRYGRRGANDHPRDGPPMHLPTLFGEEQRPTPKASLDSSSRDGPPVRPSAFPEDQRAVRRDQINNHGKEGRADRPNPFQEDLRPPRRGPMDQPRNGPPDRQPLPQEDQRPPRRAVMEEQTRNGQPDRPTPFQEDQRPPRRAAMDETPREMPPDRTLPPQGDLRYPRRGPRDEQIRPGPPPRPMGPHDDQRQTRRGEQSRDQTLRKNEPPPMGRDLRGGPPAMERELRGPPPAMERELRGPPPAMERELRRGPREFDHSARDGRRADFDRREPNEWPGDRRSGGGPDRREDLERKDAGGRVSKRGRHEAPDAAGDWRREKRTRRGP